MPTVKAGRGKAKATTGGKAKATTGGKARKAKATTGGKAKATTGGGARASISNNRTVGGDDPVIKPVSDAFIEFKEMFDKEEFNDGTLFNLDFFTDPLTKLDLENGELMAWAFKKLSYRAAVFVSNNIHLRYRIGRPIYLGNDGSVDETVVQYANHREFMCNIAKFLSALKSLIPNTLPDNIKKPIGVILIHLENCVSALETFCQIGQNGGTQGEFFKQFVDAIGEIKMLMFDGDEGETDADAELRYLMWQMCTSAGETVEETLRCVAYKSKSMRTIPETHSQILKKLTDFLKSLANINYVPVYADHLNKAVEMLEKISLADNEDIRKVMESVLSNKTGRKVQVPQGSYGGRRPVRRARR